MNNKTWVPGSITVVSSPYFGSTTTRRYWMPVLERLRSQNFYEASPEVNELLKRVDIDRDYGSRGIRVEEWPSYRPCVKTMNEFTNAYPCLKKRCLRLLRR